MKKLFFIVMALVCFYQSNAQLFTFSFSGTSGACPTANNSATFSNGTVTSITRMGSPTCAVANNVFSTSNWTTSSSLDSSQYFYITITANPGYKLDLTSLSVTISKSSTGPSSMQVIHNGTTTSNASSTYTLTTNDATNYSWDFTDFSSAGGGSVTFKVYCWNATGSSGTVRLTSLSVGGVVSLASPLSFNYIYGRMGISATTPLTKLHVNNGSNKGGLLIQNNNGDNWISDTVNGYNYLRGTSIFADHGGKVGFGTDSFTNNDLLLQIGKDNDSTHAAVYVGSYRYTGVGAAQFGGNWPYGGRWGFGPSGAIESNYDQREVKIGRINEDLTWTNDGTAALAVDGQLRVKSDIGPPPANSSQLELYYSPGSNTGYIKSTTRGSAGAGHPTTFRNMIFNDLMYFNTNNAIGIGTASTNDTAYKLFVEKGIRTRKVKVDYDSWPDYVFNTRYKLKPLSEVEKYITTNNHLPEVPSAEEVKKDGVDLGTSQAILLKKIEELTLYLIDQNKKIEKLQKQNKKIAVLEKQVAALSAAKK